MKNTKKIYILFTRFPDNGSKVIEALTGTYYSHTSIGLEEDLNTFYSFVSKGFIVEKITRYVKPDRVPFPCQLYELAVPEKIYCQIKEALQYFVQFKEIVYYAKLGLILSLLRIPYKRNYFGFFCSQFVAEVLQKCDAAKLPKKKSGYLPDDVKQLPGLKLNYQGNLRTLVEHLDIASA